MLVFDLALNANVPNISQSTFIRIIHANHKQIAFAIKDNSLPNLSLCQRNLLELSHLRGFIFNPLKLVFQFGLKVLQLPFDR